MASTSKEEKTVIDKAWEMKIPEFTPQDNPHGLLEESSFATLFPHYREQYLREVWDVVKKCLSEHNIVAELDLMESSMTVKTTRKTWDPYIILKARDMIKLMARGVPFEQAKRVLEDDISCDIIQIGKFVRKRERFVKRRQRLIGTNGSSLKALEILSNCYILIQGQTVSAIGPYKGLQQVRTTVEENFLKNVHPIYSLKRLMIKRELMRDPKLKNENWERFLGKFHKTNVSKRKAPKIKKEKKPYTPFPPPQPESKVDKLLSTGEYFLTKEERKSNIIREKHERQQEAAKKREERRQQMYVPPVEKPTANFAPQLRAEAVDLNALKARIEKARKGGKKGI